MKITITTDEAYRLLCKEAKDGELTFEANAPEIDFAAAVQEGVAKNIDWAGALYQEIRKQVDGYMNLHLRAHVGNYVRNTSRTADVIMKDEIEAEVNRGIRSAIKRMAEEKIRESKEAVKMVETLFRNK